VGKALPAHGSRAREIRTRALKSREGVLLSELESLTRRDIVVRSDATVQQERFEIY